MNYSRAYFLTIKKRVASPNGTIKACSACTTLFIYYIKGKQVMSIYKNYKLVTLDQRFIAETIARTGSEQLLDKLTRSYVGLYDNQESWYLPLRANIGKNKPPGAFFETPFPTDNPHFKRPGIDFEKALFVPDEFIIPIRNTLPQEQAKLINEQSNIISDNFEQYVLKLENISKKSPSYRFSTVPLFPEGMEKIKHIISKEREELVEENDLQLINDLAKLKESAAALNTSVKETDAEKFSKLSSNQREAILLELTSKQLHSYEHPSNKSQIESPDFEI